MNFKIQRRKLTQAVLGSMSALTIAYPSIYLGAWVEASGVVEQIVTYSTSDTVLIKLSSTGAAGVCSDASLFAVDGAIPADRRKQLVAQLSAAQARAVPVAITFYNTNGCVSWDGNPIALSRGDSS